MMTRCIIVVLILFFTALISGCACTQSCKSCYPVQKFDKLPFPLTEKMREEISSISWYSDKSPMTPFPASELEENMKLFQRELTRLTTYYMQSSAVIKINRNDILREEKDGQTFLFNQNKEPLHGVYVLTLYKNFYSIMDIHNGLPDGASIQYYYTPVFCFYGRGYYNNGKPANGSFTYLYEHDLLLPFSFDYYKGVFVRINAQNLLALPLWKKYNTISVYGKILYGYSLNKMEYPKKILFNQYNNGKIVKVVELNDTELNYPISSIQNLFKVTLENVILNKYAPKDWR